MRAITGLPAVDVEGLSLSEASQRALVQVRVQQRLMLPAQCELVFAGEAGTLPSVMEGASMTVRVEGEALFSGSVAAQQYVYAPSGARELRVRAYDALSELQFRQHVRAHIDVTLADIAREYADDAGFRVDAHADSPLWSWVLQHNQTDFEFLREAADRAGLVYTLRDGTLHIFRMTGLDDLVTLHLGTSLLEAQIDLRSTSTPDVQTAGWHPLDFSLHRDGRRDAGDSGVFYRVNDVLSNDAQARARSQSERDRRVAGQRVFWGVAEGDPRLAPGGRIHVEGVDAAAAGEFVLTSVTHTLDSASGFISELDTQPPSPAGYDMRTIATVGEVSRIGGKNGRIKVQLNAFEARQDIETEWLSVVTPGAGKDKGIIALPDVGDTVMVLLRGTFPAQGVVLGGIYGADSPPDDGVTRGRRKRFTLRSSGGQRIQFDDNDGSLQFENDDGSRIELAPGKVTLVARADLDIAAPGKTITIRGSQINFEQG